MRTAVVGARAEPPRVAVAVSREVGNAVTRNRVRRRVRAAVREHRELLENGRAYLFRPDRAAAVATYHELSDAVRALIVDGRAGST